MIKSITTRDARFPLDSGHGSDAIHRDPIYSYAVTHLEDSSHGLGSGLAFTLGEGNELVCKVAEFFAARLPRVGKGRAPALHPALSRKKWNALAFQ